MNKVILIGNLTRDPELKAMPSGISLCSFSIAVNRRRKVEGQPEVDFFNITTWRGLADNCAKYLAKGRKVGVVGQIQMRSYEANDGTKRTAVDIVADDVEFLSSADGGRAQDSGAATGADRAGDQGFVQVDEDELPF